MVVMIDRVFSNWKMRIGYRKINGEDSVSVRINVP